MRPPFETSGPRWFDRVPWPAVAITLAVVVSSGMAVPPILDAATGEEVVEASLSRPLGYLLLAPLSNVFDTLVLLSLRQHIALATGAFVLLASWRVWRALRGASRWSHLMSLAVFFVGIIVLYAAAALLPRPMAALVSDNANILRVDFHSHTNASHDSRQSVEANRRWHEAAGFDVAFVTDHYAVAGAERAIATNPRVAGEGTVLLQSIETAWNGEHVTILGAQRTYNGLMTPDLRNVDTSAVRLGSIIPSREPVIVWNHPRDLTRLPAHSGPGTGGIRAIEIVNGGPKDIDRVRANRAAMLALAERADLALTAGTDNHGWGRAAPGWTLLRIFNWRSMTPDALAIQIDAVIRGGAFGSTRVVERRVADSRQMVWASVVTVPARMLTTLSNDERVVWILWTWLLTGGIWLWRRRYAER